MLSKGKQLADKSLGAFSLKKLSIGVQGISFIGGTFLFLFGGNFNQQITGIVLLGVSNLCYSLRNLGERVLLFFFTIMLFTFMYSRPLISMLRGDIWWYFESESIHFSLTALFLTTICLFLGSVFCSIVLKKGIKLKRKKDVRGITKKSKVTLFTVTACFLLVTWLCGMLLDVEKLLFVRAHTYEEFYVSFSSRAPLPITAFATMLPFALCFFLALKPRKKVAFPTLALYVIGGLPTLVMGQRNTLVLRLLFVLVYYIIQNRYDNRDVWMGKFEKYSLAIGTPMMLVLLGAYNYLRAGTSVGTSNIFSIIADFFYKQGTQFDTLTSGYEYYPKMAFTEFKNYTFGGFIDSLRHGFIAQKLFGVPGLGTGNNPYRGMVSNSYAHNLAYVYRRDAYLAGNGNGGSYLLDLNADFGYFGIIIYSLLLGFLLLYFVRMFVNKGYISSLFVLCCLQDIFWTPRGGATEFLLFLIKPSFWISVIGVAIGYVLFSKLLPRKWLIFLEGKDLI